MIALPAASTISRRLTGRELPGSAVLAQHITLWVGFLGALVATISGKHLALSTLDLVPAGTPRRVARFFNLTVSAAVCALLAWASARLVASEWTGFGTVALGIRVAWSELVMPIGFGFMALRFAWRAADDGGSAWALRAASLAVAVAAFLLGRATPGPTLVWVLVL